MPRPSAGLAATVGAYRIDQQALDDGLAFFRQDKFERRAPRSNGPTPPTATRRRSSMWPTRTTVKGWGRLSSDDLLFKQGLDAVNRAIALAPDNRLVVTDQPLTMRSGDELKAELERGLRREASDFNPLRVLEPRK